MARIISIAICLTMVIGTPTTALAEEIVGSGHVTTEPTEVLESVDLGDGRLIRRGRHTQSTTAADPTHPFHGTSSTCFVSQLRVEAETSLISSAAPDGRRIAAFAKFCERIDADGDVSWVWTSGDGNEGRWGAIHGTGKFEGMEGGGTWQVLSAYPTGRVISRWQGTLQMK